jgi:hypothetical protein
MASGRGAAAQRVPLSRNALPGTARSEPLAAQALGALADTPDLTRCGDRYNSVLSEDSRLLSGLVIAFGGSMPMHFALTRSPSPA